MDYLQLRCPSCAKLYQVNSTQIYSSEPHFNCVDCAAQFTFSFPPMDETQITTRLLSVSVAPSLNLVKQVQAELKSIPPSVVESTSVQMQKWQSILENYNNISLHQDYVQYALSEKKLDEIKVLYQNLLKAQGKDHIAERMLRQISVLQNMKPMLSKQDVKNSFLKKHEPQKLPLKMIPIVVGFSMILIGLISHSHRNLIGLGLAVVVLVFGLPQLRKLQL
jgi:hypothetical protein